MRIPTGVDRAPLIQTLTVLDRKMEELPTLRQLRMMLVLDEVDLVEMANDARAVAVLALNLAAACDTAASVKPTHPATDTHNPTDAPKG